MSSSIGFLYIIASTKMIRILEKFLDLVSYGFYHFFYRCIEWEFWHLGIYDHEHITRFSIG